jgi:hypothetical protein
MTTTTPAESDPFFELLTDALRAGPGSDKWSEAVAKLRDGGVNGADEYNILIRAREDLQQGRDFRKVVPGAGFTHKVLEAVAQEGKKRKGIPTATIVALLCGVVILGVIITVIVLMSGNGGGGNAQQVAIDRLDSITLPVSIASGSVPGSPKGFEPAVPLTGDADGSMTTSITLDPNLAAAIECEFVVPPAGGPLIQLVVSDSNTKPNDLAVTYSDGRASVDVLGKGPDPVTIGTPGQSMKLSIRFDRDVAIVDVGGRRIFAGPHHLTATPRLATMRLHVPPGYHGEKLQVKSVSVAQAAPAAAGSR